MELKRWADFTSKNDFCHVATNQVGKKRPDLHNHDFLEVFWVVYGHGVHHVNDEEQRLELGNLVFIRADDAHEFVENKLLQIVNIAMPISQLEALRSRYACSPAVKLLWPSGRLPWMGNMAEDDRLRLSFWADQLPALQDDELAVDAFLLDLAMMLARASTRDIHMEPIQTPPLWLSHTLDCMVSDPSVAYQAGELAQEVGKAPEYINRVVRRCYGVTTTQLLNHIRLTKSAIRLRTSNDPITAIAFEAGYESLSNFYHAFGKKFSTSPRQYRQRGIAPLQ